MTFVSLQPLQVYCVCVKVESESTEASNISAVHCIKLPLGNLSRSRLLFKCIFPALGHGRNVLIRPSDSPLLCCAVYRHDTGCWLPLLPNGTAGYYGFPDALGLLTEETSENA